MTGWHSSFLSTSIEIKKVVEEARLHVSQVPRQRRQGRQGGGGGGRPAERASQEQEQQQNKAHHIQLLQTTIL